MTEAIHVTSEIGALKRVIIHRPDGELENLMPDYMERLLFDDIPYLPAIQKEHDVFADELRKAGAEVLYLRDLMIEVLRDQNQRTAFCKEFLRRYYAFEHDIFQEVLSYLTQQTPEGVFKAVTSGILKKDIRTIKKTHLADMLGTTYPFYVDPMTNLYFTRDSQSVIGNTVSINAMDQRARSCEPFLMETVFQKHPSFSSKVERLWMNRDHGHSIEGGDILVLSAEVLAIGVSARTSPQGIEHLASALFNEHPTVKKVIAIELPKSRAFMHLDTVFTMVDHDMFTIHPLILGPRGDINVFVMSPEGNGEITIKRETDLKGTLCKLLGVSNIAFIPCGGGDHITAAREQWSDGANTFALAPGKVMTYERNATTNRLLREAGLDVVEIPDSELSRGRGGPRCMTFPILRDDVTC
ncbi:arginine deiminase [Aureibacillus halotolerans]|uniref:Arginine deiminase n=1 Tax=Aureibacillus halotolerans TaxID=1508390 RepID=A0A4R6U039_9BACI|nr:arginine deiminase [Aureibacillus halotolerans]TDQ36414.1 arginine deiminase [Aureibacillus halotolerans]